MKPRYLPIRSHYLRPFLNPKVARRCESRRSIPDESRREWAAVRLDSMPLPESPRPEICTSHPSRLRSPEIPSVVGRRVGLQVNSTSQSGYPLEKTCELPFD